MGGDDSQKLLPWRGILLLSRAQTSGSLRNQHCNGNGAHVLRGCLRNCGSATDCLGHSWQAQVGQFWRAPKPCLRKRILGAQYDS
jgi:hypothetical protein